MCSKPQFKKLLCPLVCWHGLFSVPDPPSGLEGFCFFFLPLPFSKLQKALTISVRETWFLSFLQAFKSFVP